jgi:hypothetical protein
MLPARVIVVSTKLVVRLAAVILAVPLALNNVPLGNPALSVSIRKLRFDDGDAVFLSASLNVVIDTQLPNTGIATLVLSVEYEIAC